MLCAAGAPAHAEIATVHLEKVVEWADLVVLGTVREVREEDGKPVARVEVLEAFKGDAPAELYYFAGLTWPCDSTTAVEGETALFFLAHHPPLSAPKAGRRGPQTRLGNGQPLLYIVHSGRGRMTLRTVGGQRYATVTAGGIQFPDSLPSIPGPQPDHSYIRSFALDELVEFVRTRPKSRP